MARLITIVDPYTLTNKVQPNTSYPLEQFLEERVPPGWRPLARQLVLDLFELGWDGKLFQIKEKLGGLRFYLVPIAYGGTKYEQDSAIWDRIWRAENDSYKFCEMCGREGFLCRSGYLLKTLCASHLDNYSGSFEPVNTTTNEEGANKDGPRIDKQRAG